jgi:hypothetical protein
MNETQNVWYISPHYRNIDFQYPLSLNDKITIFLDRTHGWQLDIADQVINGKKAEDGTMITKPMRDSGFAALSIVLSYFEMIAKYEEGYTGKSSSPYFKKGVYSVFPNLNAEFPTIVDDALTVLYKKCRCGLYHMGLTNRQIVLSGKPQFPMRFDITNRRLHINPHLLVPALKIHLEDYGKRLRDKNNVQLRSNFEKRFDYEDPC